MARRAKYQLLMNIVAKHKTTPSTDSDLQEKSKRSVPWMALNESTNSPKQRAFVCNTNSQGISATLSYPMGFWLLWSPLYVMYRPDRPTCKGNATALYTNHVFTKKTLILQKSGMYLKRSPLNKYCWMLQAAISSNNYRQQSGIGVVMEGDAHLCVIELLSNTLLFKKGFAASFFANLVIPAKKGCFSFSMSFISALLQRNLRYIWQSMELKIISLSVR